MVFVERKNLLLQFGLHGDIVVRSRTEIQAWPADRQAGRVVGWTLHLVNIPVGGQIAQVAHTCIAPHALDFLVVPKRECVVVAVGKDNGIAFILQGHEIVLPKIAASITSAAVVVIPCLAGHLNGH